MIHVIDHCSAEDRRPLLHSMFADRKRLFVDLFGWDVPVVDDAYEMDQFDNANTIYLIAADDAGAHAASIRLYPTALPHMLGTLFPHLCPLGVPAGDTVWESSRLCLPQRHGAEGRRALRNRLFTAMVDVALERGIEHYTGVIPDSFRKEVLSMGWQAEPLGPAARIPGGPIGAFQIHIGSDTPALDGRLFQSRRTSGGMTASVDHQAAALARDGWCVVPRALDPAIVAGIEADLEPRFAATPMCEGVFYGPRTRRFGSLLNRSAGAERLVMQPAILAIVERMLLPWCERIALNLTQAIEIHPGALPQLPHRDQDMWQGPKGTLEYLVNVMWPLTPFTADNGGTRLWIGSHIDQDIAVLPEEESIVPRVSPGDALLFLGSTLHGGGGNRSAAPRRGIIVSYCLGWLKPFELQWLVYPPAVARHFSPELAALVGYAQHRPNLGNVEGQCPSILLRDCVPDFLPAIDALRPDQAEAAEMFVRDQMGELG